MSRSFVTACVLLLTAGAARAEDIAGRVSLSLQVGTQSELAGKIISGGTGSLLGKPTSVVDHTYKDVYKPEVRVQGSVGYGVSERWELVARVSRYKSGRRYETSKSGVVAGTFDDKPMYAFFSGYGEWSFELAARYYIAPQARLKSFIAPVAGLRSLDEVVVTLSMPDASAAVQNMPFTRAGRVPVFGLDLGFGFDLTERFFVGVDSGLRYQGGPKPSRTFPELGPVDASEGRWTAPVVAMLGVRF